MALDLLRSAKSILKIDDLTIDNIVFKLHYRVTVAILIGSSLVGVAKQVTLDILNFIFCIFSYFSISVIPSIVRPALEYPAQCWMTTAGYIQPFISDLSTK